MPPQKAIKENKMTNLVHVGQNNWVDINNIVCLKIWKNYPALDRFLITYRDGQQVSSYGYASKLHAALKDGNQKPQTDTRQLLVEAPVSPVSMPKAAKMVGSKASLTKQEIMNALTMVNFNAMTVSRCAELMGVGRSTIYRYLAEARSQRG